MAEERKYISIVTDLGAEKIIDAVRNGKKVDIIHFAVGDGGGLPYRPTKDMLTLKNEVWRGDITKYEIMEQSPNVIRVTALLPSNVGGFTVREMGLFDSENAMIAIANTADIVKVRSTDGMQTEVEIAMRIAVSNTDAVVFEIDPNLVYVSQKDLEKHNTSDFAHEKLIARKIAESTIQRNIVIPATGWAADNAEGGGGGVYIEIEQKDVTEKMIPLVSIFPSDMRIASACGMSTTVQTVNGAIRFYADKAPTKEIKASLVLLRASSNVLGDISDGTDSDMNIEEFYKNYVATQEEVEKVLEEVFEE